MREKSFKKNSMDGNPYQGRGSDLYKAILSGKSIPMFFLERVEKYPDSVAFRYKDLGIIGKSHGGNTGKR